jgi:hypothetical protein
LQFAAAFHASALPPKADISQRYSDVRFVPKADIGTSSDVRRTERSAA